MKFLSRIPLLWYLGALFCAGKLAGWLNWSWVWITVPFWGPYALVVGLLASILVGALIVALVGFFILSEYEPHSR